MSVADSYRSTDNTLEVNTGLFSWYHKPTVFISAVLFQFKHYLIKLRIPFIITVITGPLLSGELNPFPFASSASLLRQFSLCAAVSQWINSSPSTDR